MPGCCKPPISCPAMQPPRASAASMRLPQASHTLCKRLQSAHLRRGVLSGAARGRGRAGAPHVGVATTRRPARGPGVQDLGLEIHTYGFRILRRYSGSLKRGCCRTTPPEPLDCASACRGTSRALRLMMMAMAMCALAHPRGRSSRCVNHHSRTVPQGVAQIGAWTHHGRSTRRGT